MFGSVRAVQAGRDAESGVLLRHDKEPPMTDRTELGTLLGEVVT